MVVDEIKLDNTAENPEVVVPTNADTVQAVGADLLPMYRWWRECVEGLAAARRGPISQEQTHRILTATTELLPRLAAIQSAVVRTHLRRNRGDTTELPALLGIPADAVPARCAEAADPATAFTAWVVYGEQPAE